MSPIERALRLAAYLYLARWLPEGPMPGGKYARRIRRTICGPLFAHTGCDINVERDARFGDGSKVRLGDRSSLGVRSRLHGTITIGNYVMMGPDVSIFTQAHGMSTEKPMIRQAHPPERPVVIGDDVWIGARVTILPGVEIGDGVVIGAGSVVTKDVPSGVVAAGNPCRVLRAR